MCTHLLILDYFSSMPRVVILPTMSRATHRFLPPRYVMTAPPMDAAGIGQSQMRFRGCCMRSILHIASYNANAIAAILLRHHSQSR